jgi:hypothetical protein
MTAREGGRQVSRERPIIFSASMVRAILNGTKTQTRRTVQPQPAEWLHPMPCPSTTPEGWQGPLDHSLWAHEGDEHDGESRRCPYGQPGDRLWVRETFAIVPRTAYRCSEGVQQTLRPDDDHDAAIYREGWTRSRGGFRWRPSIHMPRWASRIELKVTGIRVERLQDISEADCIAEGIERGVGFPGWYRYPLPGDAPGLSTAGKVPTAYPRLAYRALWASINGPGAWDANPWVWVVEFKRC